MAVLTEDQKLERVDEIKQLVDDTLHTDAIEIVFNAALGVFLEICASNDVSFSEAHSEAHRMVCLWFEHVDSDDDDDITSPPNGVAYSGNA